MPEPIETERLLIRELSASDLLDCHRLNLDIGWNEPSLAEKEALERRQRWLEWTIRGYEQLRLLDQPPYGERAVVLKEGHVFVGLIGLVPLLAPFGQLPSRGGRALAPFTAEVGLFWAVSPAHQGRGIASEAGRALANFAFQALRVERVLACTEYDNVGSIAVMRSLGMQLERNPEPEPPWFQITGTLERPE